MSEKQLKTEDSADQMIQDNTQTRLFKVGQFKYKNAFTKLEMSGNIKFKQQLKQGIIHKARLTSLTVGPFQQYDEGYDKKELVRYMNRYILKQKYVKQYMIRNSKCNSDSYFYNTCFDDWQDHSELLLPSTIFKRHLKLLPELETCDFDHIQGSKPLINLIIYDHNRKKLKNVNMRVPIDVSASYGQFDFNPEDFPMLKNVSADLCSLDRLPNLSIFYDFTRLRLFFGDNFDAPLYFVNEMEFSVLGNQLQKISKLKTLILDFDNSCSSQDVIEEDKLIDIGKVVKESKILETIYINSQASFSQGAYKQCCEYMAQNEEKLKTIKWGLDLGQYGDESAVEEIFEGVNGKKDLGFYLYLGGAKSYQKRFKLFEGKKEIVNITLDFYEDTITEENIDQMIDLVKSLENLKEFRVCVDRAKGADYPKMNKLRTYIKKNHPEIRVNTGAVSLKIDE